MGWTAKNGQGRSQGEASTNLWQTKGGGRHGRPDRVTEQAWKGNNPSGEGGVVGFCQLKAGQGMAAMTDLTVSVSGPLLDTHRSKPG